MKTFQQITQELTELHERKNHDYGGSFTELYQLGGDHYASCRLYEKVKRFVTLTRSEAKVKDESIDDTLMDIASYAIMTLVERSKTQAAGISNSQQYKMAGNSIVVSCLVGIFRQMFMPVVYDDIREDIQTSLFDYKNFL